MEMASRRGQLEQVLGQLVAAGRRHYGERLTSLVVFGSVGRGTPRPDSDIDILLIATDLPRGRVPRVEEFAAVERALAASSLPGRPAGLAMELSPVLKTPEEAQAGSPLFLDMVEDARILYDRDGFFAGVLARLKTRLARLGARRIWRGNAWVWDLKPDYRPGEVFELFPPDWAVRCGHRRTGHSGRDLRRRSPGA